jgi:hypothetical protein
MNPPQTEALLGLALNIASIISVWIEAEEERRKTNLIETRRRHLVRGKLDSMMRRTGSYFQIVMDDGTLL